MASQNRADGPTLEIGDASVDHLAGSSGGDPKADLVVDPGPAHRPEEPDGVVLRAVALQVAGDERLVPPALRVALACAGPVPQQHIDAGLQRVPVLPGDGLPEPRLAGQLMEGRGQP